LQLARDIWNRDSFLITDDDRSKSLRTEILERLLGLVMTDNERAQFFGLPEGCRVRESAKIIAPKQLKCGKFVWIGENSIVDASGGLTIGDHTTIAVGANVWSHSSALANIQMDNRSGNPWIIRKETKIGAGCYIGGPSSIYPGVTIGDRCIVMPMSVVTTDIPANSMVAGSPAKVIQPIDEAWIKKFQASIL
jgi:acetyltransferase-like isoleucine patch superfamily enzyme